MLPVTALVYDMPIIDAVAARMTDRIDREAPGTFPGPGDAAFGSVRTAIEAGRVGDPFSESRDVFGHDV